MPYTGVIDLHLTFVGDAQETVIRLQADDMKRFEELISQSPPGVFDYRDRGVMQHIQLSLVKMWHKVPEWVPDPPSPNAS